MEEKRKETVRPLVRGPIVKIFHERNFSIRAAGKLARRSRSFRFLVGYRRRLTE